jgi:hypothetical protein
MRGTGAFFAEIPWMPEEFRQGVLVFFDVLFGPVAESFCHDRDLPVTLQQSSEVASASTRNKVAPEEGAGYNSHE